MATASRLPEGKENLLDAIDRATDEMREIAKRWQDRLTVDRQSIAENYTNGRLSLICDLNIFVPEAGVGRDLRVDERPLGYGEVFASAIFAVDCPNVRNVLLRNQEPVLVFNVECVKTPEGFSAPSLVRLYGIHDEVDDCFGGLLFQSTITGDYKIIPGVVDRELSVLGSNAPSRKLDIVQLWWLGVRCESSNACSCIFCSCMGGGTAFSLDGL